MVVSVRIFVSSSERILVDPLSTSSPAVSVAFRKLVWRYDPSSTVHRALACAGVNPLSAVRPTLGARGCDGPSRLIHDRGTRRDTPRPPRVSAPTFGGGSVGRCGPAPASHGRGGAGVYLAMLATSPQ